MENYFKIIKHTLGMNVDNYLSGSNASRQIRVQIHSRLGY